MKSPRAIKIKEELLKSFAIRGTIKEIPKLEELNAQAMLVDSKLNPNIEIRHLSYFLIFLGLSHGTHQ